MTATYSTLRHQELLNMDEVRSNVGSSTHSLYPSVVCVSETMQRSVSAVSNQSDYYTIANVNASSTPALAEATEEEETTAERAPLIPLADLDRELKLSAISISSR